jgi:hypothetical protein
MKPGPTKALLERDAMAEIDQRVGKQGPGSPGWGTRALAYSHREAAAKASPHYQAAEKWRAILESEW